MARVLVQGRADLTTKASGSTPIQLAEAYGKQDSAFLESIQVLVRKDQTLRPILPYTPFWLRALGRQEESGPGFGAL